MNPIDIDNDTRMVGTTHWYRSIEVWMVLSPLIATVLAMIVTIIILSGTGSVNQLDDLGQPLGKVYTGLPEGQLEDSEPMGQDNND